MYKRSEYNASSSEGYFKQYTIAGPKYQGKFR